MTDASWHLSKKGTLLILLLRSINNTQIMKILHIVWSMKNGGIENMLADIINEHIKTENITLLVINNIIDDNIISRIDKRCHFIFLKRKQGSKNPLFVLKLNSIILCGKYDIVHLHPKDIINKLFVKANYVRTVHANNQKPHNYRWHKSVIAISESVKQELDALGNVDSTLINNGINFNLIKELPKRKTDGVFKIVQVSRIFFRDKGQDILLKALNEVIKKGNKKVHLDFIGNGPDFDNLKRMVYESGLSEYISLLGDCTREYIYNNLCKYDLFVQPSRLEGFGLTVVEAIAAGVPVLVSKNHGPLQIIENGKYGFCFKSEDYMDAAQQIINIINKYPNEQFLCDAYNHAKLLYSVERTAKEYLDVYKKILKLR